MHGKADGTKSEVNLKSGLVLTEPFDILLIKTFQATWRAHLMGWLAILALLRFSKFFYHFHFNLCKVAKQLISTARAKKNCVYLGIGQKGGLGQNPCSNGLWQFFSEYKPLMRHLIVIIFH